MTPEMIQQYLSDPNKLATELGLNGKEPWKQTILTFVADNMHTYGLDNGWRTSNETILKVMNGRATQSDLADTDLGTASDLLSQLENAEADHRNAVFDFLAKIGNIFGPLIGGLIKAL